MPKSRKQESSSTFIFWIIGLVAVLLAAMIFLSNIPKQVDLDYSEQPFIGKESAPVKIVEFGDYKCPYCKNFNETFFPQIQKDLVDTGKASFYFINYSFINVDSTRAAKFAEAVYQQLGNETFWKFHELLYEKFPGDMESEKQDLFTEDYLAQLLGEVASEEDVKKADAAFQSEEAEDAWEKDMDLAKELGVQSTPSVFINGEEFTGNSFEDFQEAVNKAAEGE
jgi:protein-disulfide isomerase